MEWTQPHFLTASIKGPRWYISTICNKKSEEGPDHEGFDARYRFGKEHLSYPRGRLQGRGSTAETTHPQATAAVPGETGTMSGRYGGLCGRSLPGPRDRKARPHGEADEPTLRHAIP